MPDHQDHELRDYGLGQDRHLAAIAVPDLPYLPPRPKDYNPGVGLIGCGNISEHHLRAYDAAGIRVLGLCDLDEARAAEHRRLFYPDAAVSTDAREMLRRPDIEVVDIATLPEARGPLIEAALDAGKHVLSQKPFATDLAAAEALVAHAERAGRLLAVNQSGRWSPHWSFTHQAIQAGLLGEVLAADFAVYWNHEWVVGTPFDDTPHLLLFDFGMHWFDAALRFFAPRKARRVAASVRHATGQQSKQALLGQATVEFEGGGQASFRFHGASPHYELDSSVISGTKGSVHSIGPSLQRQALSLITAQGRAKPRWSEAWFPDGFHGALGELLCAIEEEREPEHSARNNLATLELCLAACASSQSDESVEVGTVREMPGSSTRTTE